MKNRFRLWSDIRVFLAVMRDGSTLAASKSLGMAQPTVARRIDALEHDLGVTLFHRDTRGFRPTSAATTLRPFAEAAEAAMLALSDAAQAQRDGERKLIRITSGAATFTENFAAIVSEFREAHPDVAFDFDSSHALVDLAAGQADIAIRYAPAIEDERLICRKLFETRLSLYGSEAYARAHGLPGNIDALAGHRFILGKGPLGGYANRRLDDRIKPDQVAMHCADFDSLVMSVVSGFGLGLMGAGIARGNDKLIRCFPPPPEWQIGVWLVIGPEAYKRPEIKAFTAFFAPRYGAFLKAQWDEMDAADTEKSARHARYFAR